MSPHSYIVVVMLHEYARQGVEDPESPEGSVSAQTMNVDLKEKNYYFIHFAFEKPLARCRLLNYLVLHNYKIFKSKEVN